MDAKIRKYQDILRISGKAVVLFGVWSIIRLLVLKFFDPDTIEAAFINPALGINDKGMADMVFDIAIITLIIDLVFRLIIGRCAVSEGEGKKRSVVYIIFAIIYVVYTIVIEVLDIVNPFRRDIDLLYISTWVIDLTTCMAIIEIVISSIKLRKLKKVQ